MHHFYQQCTRDSLILSCANIFRFPEERADSFTWCEELVFVIEPDSARLLKKLRSAYYRVHSFYVISQILRNPQEKENQGMTRANPSIVYFQASNVLPLLNTFSNRNRVRAPGFLKCQS